MNISEKVQDGVRGVIPSGRLDSSTSPEFETQLLTGLDHEGARLVLDFSELEYISSAGLRAVLIASKHIKINGGKMALCALKESIREVFEISGFLNILTVCGDVEAAVNASA